MRGVYFSVIAVTRIRAVIAVVASAIIRVIVISTFMPLAARIAPAIGVDGTDMPADVFILPADGARTAYVP